MTALRRLRLLVLLAVVPLAFLSLRETSAVNRCLHAGGSYDQVTRRCDAASFQVRRAPAPRLGRSQVLLGAVVVALAGLGVAVYLRSRAVRRRVS